MRYRGRMRFLRSLALAFAFLCALPSPAHAQKIALSQIKFVGDPSHTQAELLAFSKLNPAGATQQEVQDAAQRFGDTGLFDEVNFQAGGSTLTFTLTPTAAGAMLPVRFSNFVWWDDQDLSAALDGKIPLYHGGPVPVSGNLRDQITAALQAIVAAKGVPNPTVTSVLSASHLGGSPDTIAFSIDSPRVLVRSLTLQQASPVMVPKLARVLRDETGEQWDKSATLAEIASRVGEVYRNDGYLDIAVTHLDHPVPVLGAGGIYVDLTATLSEGQPYHVAQLAWAGSDLISTATFAAEAPLKIGDPASPAALRASLTIISAAYGTRGFIDAKVDAAPQIDRAAHRVAYIVTVQPGPQYHFRLVNFTGLTDAQLKSLDDAWHLNPGDNYDAGYVNRFLGQNAPPYRQAYKIAYTLRRNPDLTVDLTIAFTPLAEPPRPN